MHEQIELGSKVECKITGFTGTVTGRCEYLHASTRCLVTPKIRDTKGDNKYKEGTWLNEAQLEVLK